MKNIMENLCNNIAFGLCQSKDKNCDEYEILRYGVFVFLHVCNAVILTIIFGLLTGTCFEICIISLMAALMKRNSGGVHCSSPNRCIITGIIISYMFVLIGKTLINVKLDILYILSIIILIHSFLIIYIKCPVPSPNKPLKKETTRKRLRKNALYIYFICVILFIISILLNLLNTNYNLNSLVLYIILGMYMQVFALTTFGSEFILFIDKVLLKIKV